MLNRSDKRRGTILVLVSISLIAIFGVVAIVIDGGLLYDRRRSAQAAADSAALAAASDLFLHYGANSGLDTGGTAKASALSTAAANGFTNTADSDALTDPNDPSKSSVTVNIPPLSGNFVGKAGYAEVIVTFYQRRGFSGIFGSSNVPVKARAVAYGNPGTIGILILDPSISDSCEIDGNVNILNNGQIWVNSTDSAATQVANTSTLSCGGLNLVGGLSNSGSITYTGGGGLQTGVSPVADPLASIPEPTTSGLTNYGSPTINSDTTLQPGIYTNITVKSGTVTLSPGIYYLANGGSFQLQGGSLQGTGVMFFDGTGGDKIFNKAMGPINITPPSSSSGGTWPTGTTSATYNGISFWIARAQTKEMHLQSLYNVTMPGTFYAQGGEFDFRPDGATTVFNTGNYICDQAEWCQGYSSSTSNGTLNINPATSAPTQRPILVE